MNVRSLIFDSLQQNHIKKFLYRIGVRHLLNIVEVYTCVSALKSAKLSVGFKLSR